MLYDFLMLYFLIISVVAVIITIFDKVAAIRGSWRISEKSLLIVSALGGSAAMFATMLIIRHKTRKPKFMIGIPAIIIAQLALALFFMVKI